MTLKFGEKSDWDTDPNLNENHHVRREVRVKELIKILSFEDPDAVLVVEDRDSNIIEITNYVVARWNEGRYVGNRNLPESRRLEDVKVVELGAYG